MATVEGWKQRWRDLFAITSNNVQRLRDELATSNRALQDIAEEAYQLQEMVGIGSNAAYRAGCIEEIARRALEPERGAEAPEAEHDQ